MGQSPTEALLAIVEQYPHKIGEAAFKFSNSPHGPFAGTVSPEDGMQMLNGFLATIKEALRGEGDTVRANYLETLTPAFINQGDSVFNSIYWNAGFMSALTATVVPLLPPDVAGEAADWLAHWAGRFVADVSRVANEAAAELERKK